MPLTVGLPSSVWASVVAGCGWLLPAAATASHPRALRRFRRRPRARQGPIGLQKGATRAPRGRIQPWNQHFDPIFVLEDRLQNRTKRGSRDPRQQMQEPPKGGSTIGSFMVEPPEAPRDSPSKMLDLNLGPLFVGCGFGVWTLDPASLGDRRV